MLTVINGGGIVGDRQVGVVIIATTDYWTTLTRVAVAVVALIAVSFAVVIVVQLRLQVTKQLTAAAEAAAD